MIRISWHRLARKELFAAADFYEGEASGLGNLLLDEIEADLVRLKDHPRLGGRILGSVRRLINQRFPYKIVYRLDPLPEGGLEIFILAIAHDKRRPQYWSGRR